MHTKRLNDSTTLNEIMVRIVYAQKPLMIVHSDVCSSSFALSFHLHPWFVYSSSEGSGESAYAQTRLSICCSTFSTKFSLPAHITFHL